MNTYLLQLSYTPGAWAAMVKNPQDRGQAVQASIKNLGGRMTSFWMAFGDHDAVGIVEMPDNVSAAAFSIAVCAGGACHNVKTTPLLSAEEAMAAMKKAGACGYRSVTAGQ